MLKDIKEFNSLAVRAYTPQVYDGKVTLFWASADLRTSIDLVEGWRALAGGGIEVHEIPGSHLDIIKEPHVGDLANKLSSCLDHVR
jgi:aspartate racemase